jgi:hypothetical protein
MSALLPPGPRGDRNCCALTATQTRTLTLGMPSVGPPYSRLTARGDSLARLDGSGGVSSVQDGIWVEALVPARRAWRMGQCPSGRFPGRPAPLSPTSRGCATSARTRPGSALGRSTAGWCCRSRASAAGCQRPGSVASQAAERPHQGMVAACREHPVPGWSSSRRPRRRAQTRRSAAGDGEHRHDVGTHPGYDVHPAPVVAGMLCRRPP